MRAYKCTKIEKRKEKTLTASHFCIHACDDSAKSTLCHLHPIQPCSNFITCFKEKSATTTLAHSRLFEAQFAGRGRDGETPAEGGERRVYSYCLPGNRHQRPQLRRNTGCKRKRKRERYRDGPAKNNRSLRQLRGSSQKIFSVLRNLSASRWLWLRNLSRTRRRRGGALRERL